MSSIEIAELLEARHDSIKRTVERLFSKGLIAYLPMVDVQEDKGNAHTYDTHAQSMSKTKENGDQRPKN